MTGKLIFKMELFKFIKDKSYIITASVIGVINIIVTILALATSSNLSNYYFESSALASIIAMFFLILFIVIIGNVVFAYITPFRMISMDYKNNVMAMMVASGVNRRKLFFSKVGAAFICTIGFMFAITIIPFLLLIIKIIQDGGWNNFLEGFSSVYRYSDSNFFKILVTYLIGYFNTLTMISASCIVMRGKGLSFLVFVGFSILNSIVVGMLGTIPYVLNWGINGIYAFQLIMSLLSIVVFGYISLRALERQNL